MLALITQNRIQNRHGSPCDSLELAYTVFFHTLGIDVIPVPNLGPDRIKAYLRKLPAFQGLILSGGNDLAPETYGATVAKVEDCALVRDETEFALLEAAIEFDLPVLGICRGMQLLNAYFGGSLVTDLAGKTGEAHAGVAHSLVIDLPVAVEYLGIREWEMASYHNQGITPPALAPVLRPFITTPGSEVLEGIFHPGMPIAGVQFHPEREKEPAAQLVRLVKAFKNRELFWE